jgi:hypothetical protein
VVPDNLGKYLAKFEEDHKDHDAFVAECEKRYDSYRGYMAVNSKAASWTNKSHPAYVLQEIETIAASFVDANPAWKVGAQSILGPAPEIAKYRLAAEALKTLLSYQAVSSGFVGNRRIDRIQALVCGISANKQYWDYKKRDRTFRRTVNTPVEGTFLTLPHSQEVTEKVVVRDDPVCEVVDVRHLIIPKNAISLDKAQRITHRIFMPFDELKLLEKTKDNPNGIYQNVDQLKDSKNFAGDTANQSKDVFAFKPDKDDVEVLEVWHKKPDGTMGLAAIGNRKVLLRDDDSPFWHGEFPFVLSSANPYPFRIRGLSDVEFLEKLQELLWAFMNQRLDNVQLLNNAIVLIRSDSEDVNAYEWAPGAQWIVDDVQQVSTLQVSSVPAEISLNAENMIRSDMQNVVGGLPLASDLQNMANSTTATAASLLMNLAQRRLAAKKQNFTLADTKIANQFIELDRQFVTAERFVEIVGQDGLPAFASINPEHWQEIDLKVKVEAMDESLVRQERRAEAQAKLQVAVSSVPQFQATGHPLNLQAFMDDFLESFGIQDKSKYYSAIPQQQVPGQTQQPLQPEQPGATAPQAIDANSPSNAFSQSPIAAQQRMAAMSGGVQ